MCTSNCYQSYKRTTAVPLDYYNDRISGYEISSVTNFKDDYSEVINDELTTAKNDVCHKLFLQSRGKKSLCEKSIRRKRQNKEFREKENNEKSQKRSENKLKQQRNMKSKHFIRVKLSIQIMSEN